MTLHLIEEDLAMEPEDWFAEEIAHLENFLRCWAAFTAWLEKRLAA